MKIEKAVFTKKMLRLTKLWLKDEYIKRLTNTPNFTDEDQLKWYNSLKENADNYKIWVINVDDIPVGVFGLKNIKKNEAEYWGYIGNKDYHGRGIGKWMIDEVFLLCIKNDISRLYLKVLKINDIALGLYKKKGFVEYQDNSEFIMMEKIF